MQVFSEYAFISRPAGTATRPTPGQFAPFRPAQHVHRGARGEFGSYEWRAAPPGEKQREERKALAPFRPAQIGGGIFSGWATHS